jgi:hypothetical protein
MVYLVITLVDYYDGANNLFPVGSVINEIIWDGVSPFTPPPDTQLVLKT